MSNYKNLDAHHSRRVERAHGDGREDRARPSTGHESAPSDSVPVCTNAPAADFTGDFLWKCRVEGCKETVFFPNEDGHVIAFLVLHHLVRKHGFTKEEALAHDSGLEGATAEYVGLSSKSER